MGNLMVPLKKFLSNKNTITILGVLIGVVVLYVGYNWRVTKSVQPVEIPICSATLISGTKITEEHISYTEVPNDVVENMGYLVTYVDDIIGKLVSYDSKIPQNGFFFSENLILEEDMPDSMFANIQDGYTVFTMEVDSKKTSGNAIFPDDTVDLYLSTTSDDGLAVYGRFIKSIQVLAVKDGEGNDVFVDRDNHTDPALLAFAVPEYLFLLLKKAEMVGIELDIVARNDSYTENAEPTEIVSEELENMIINKTYLISGECIDLTVCG